MWRRRIGATAAIVAGLHLIGCTPSGQPPAVTTAHTITPPPHFTPAASPPLTATPEPSAPGASEEEAAPVELTIIYDNYAREPLLRTAWGFACWVETGEMTVLFDTGGDGAILLHNITQLGLDPQTIDAIVLSHIHGDHTGGLAQLLDTGIEPPVYVPAAFPSSFKTDVGARTELVEVTETLEVLPGVHTTGEVGSSIVEQALVVETGDGLVAVTGCAHPGIVEMVRRAKDAVGGEVALVMGGFHLRDAGPEEVEHIIADLRHLGVQRVAPSHCTGDAARQAFVDAFGPSCTLAGAGQVLIVGG